MLIAVEGLIGQGKTTLCTNLHRECGMEFLSEPLDSNPFLKPYYENPKRWAFAMQANLLCERFAMFQHAQWLSHQCKDVCIDRSFYGDYAFAVVQVEDGYMTPDEFEAYRKMHELHQRYLLFPDLIIRLDCSIETTMQRIKSRGRECESGIPEAYIRHLSSAYDKLFVELCKIARVVTIDVEQPFSKVLSDAMNAIRFRRTELTHNDWSYPHYKGV